MLPKGRRLAPDQMLLVILWLTLCFAVDHTFFHDHSAICRYPDLRFQHTH